MESTAIDVDRGELDAAQDRGSIQHPASVQEGLRKPEDEEQRTPPPGPTTARDPAVRPLADDEGGPRTWGSKHAPRSPEDLMAPSAAGPGVQASPASAASSAGSASPERSEDASFASRGAREAHGGAWSSTSARSPDPELVDDLEIPSPEVGEAFATSGRAAPSSASGLRGILLSLPAIALSQLRRRPLARRALHRLTEASRRVTRTLERLEGSE